MIHRSSSPSNLPFQITIISSFKDFFLYFLSLFSSSLPLSLTHSLRLLTFVGNNIYVSFIFYDFPSFQKAKAERRRGRRRKDTTFVHKDCLQSYRVAKCTSIRSVGVADCSLNVHHSVADAAWKLKLLRGENRFSIQDGDHELTALAAWKLKLNLLRDEISKKNDPKWTFVGRLKAFEKKAKTQQERWKMETCVIYEIFLSQARARKTPEKRKRC